MKTFLITPRQTGKSHIAQYEFMKDPVNTLFISCKTDMFKNLTIYDPKKYKKNFISQSSVEILKGTAFKRVILDEYLFFSLKNRKLMYDVLPYLGITEYLIFSTPKYIYNKEVFDFVKELKENPVNFNDIKRINQFCDKYYASPEWITDLRYNYITDYDTTIIHHSQLVREIQINREHFYLDPVQRETEILGNYIN